MTQEHTQAPWQIEPFDLGEHNKPINYEYDGRSVTTQDWDITTKGDETLRIARVAFDNDSNPNMTPSINNPTEALANAYLIAAAPEMYNELEKTYDMLQDLIATVPAELSGRLALRSEAMMAVMLKALNIDNPPKQNSIGG